MRFLVTATAFESIVTPEDTARLREVFVNKMREIRASGKLVVGGHIVAERAGFCVLDVDSTEELFGLLLPLHDVCRIEARVVQPYEELEKVLEAHPVQ